MCLSPQCTVFFFGLSLYVLQFCLKTKLGFEGLFFFLEKKFSFFAYEKSFDFRWGTTACLLHTSKRSVTQFVMPYRDTKFRKGRPFFKFVFIFENLVVFIQTLFVVRLTKLTNSTTLLSNFGLIWLVSVETQPFLPEAIDRFIKSSPKKKEFFRNKFELKIVFKHYAVVMLVFLRWELSLYADGVN